MVSQQKTIVMDKRKTEKADLENKRGLFLQIGLVVTLALILGAFEWKSYDGIDIGDGRSAVFIEEEMIIQTDQTPPPPPPPPPQEITTELEIVADDVEVEDIIIDVSVDLHTYIDTYVPPTIEEEELEPEQHIFEVVEEMPGFPGGEEARQKFLRDNIRYPAIARESGIQGTIFVTFVVERDGSITDVRILRGIGGGCDEEALRVTRMMPRWQPGKQRGRAVRVQFNMPIRFQLQG